MSIREEERDRLECLKLAVLFVNAHKSGHNKSEDVVTVADKFYQYTRKDDGPRS